MATDATISDRKSESGSESPSTKGQSAKADDVMELYSYDDDIARKFATATLVWALVATLAGLIVALLLVLPTMFGGLQWLSFGRLRPLHTNAAIFAFAGNGIFAAIYYSTQRLCKARMWSDVLSRLHFWGWQAIIVAAAVTLPHGNHAKQRIRGVRVADRFGDRRGLARILWRQLFHDADSSTRTAHVRRVVVLHCDDCHRDDLARL